MGGGGDTSLYCDSEQLFQRRLWCSVCCDAMFDRCHLICDDRGRISDHSNVKIDNVLTKRFSHR